jgi:hypothetical protein
MIVFAVALIVFALAFLIDLLYLASRVRSRTVTSRLFVFTFTIPSLSVAIVGICFMHIYVALLGIVAVFVGLMASGVILLLGKTTTGSYDFLNYSGRQTKEENE